MTELQTSKRCLSPSRALAHLIDMLTRPGLKRRTMAVGNVEDPRNSGLQLALMRVEKIMEIRDACSSRFGCRGGVDKFRRSLAACERGRSVRPKLRRAAMRRKLHPYSRRDSREGRPRARCDNRGASACARTWKSGENGAPALTLK
jgi:hypothetical protein